MKVAGYNLFLQYLNPGLCSKFYPELPLFSLTSKESPAEVVARIGMQPYRYLLTGRADGFIVTLTSKNADLGAQALFNSKYKDRLSDLCE